MDFRLTCWVSGDLGVILFWNPMKDRYDHECILYSEVWLAGEDYLIHSFGAKSICQYVNGELKGVSDLCSLGGALDLSKSKLSNLFSSRIRIITLYIPISTCSCFCRILCCSWWKRNGPFKKIGDVFLKCVTMAVKYLAPFIAGFISKGQKACLLARRTIGGFSLFFTILVLVQEIEWPHMTLYNLDQYTLAVLVVKCDHKRRKNVIRISFNTQTDIYFESAEANTVLRLVKIK